MGVRALSLSEGRQPPLEAKDPLSVRRGPAAVGEETGVWISGCVGGLGPVDGDPARRRPSPGTLGGEAGPRDTPSAGGEVCPQVQAMKGGGT